MYKCIMEKAAGRNGGEVDVNYNVSDRFMGTNLPLNEIKQSGLLLLYDYKKKTFKF